MSAQDVTALFSLTGEGGYLTNTYLDGTGAAWERSTRSPFYALTPTGLVAWSDASNSVVIGGTYRRRGLAVDTTALSSFLGYASALREFNGNWTAGVDLVTGRYNFSAVRAVTRLSPHVTYRLSPWVNLTLRVGAGRQSTGVLAAGAPAPRTSFHASVESEVLVGGRWWVENTLYFGQSPGAPGESAYGGAGLGLGATTYLKSGAQLNLNASADQFGYRATFSSVGAPLRQYRDVMITAGAAVEWPVNPSLAFTARAGGLYLATSAPTERPYDLHLAFGVRFDVGRRLFSLRRRQPALWTEEENGHRFRFRHRGAGRLYLTGDFNNWEQPGLPLDPERRDVYTTLLRVEPGTYAYKVILITGEEIQWLPLPDHAYTVADGFGGSNGVLIVEPPASTGE